MSILHFSKETIFSVPQEEFLKNQVFSNFSRLKILSLSLLLVDLILLLTDFGHYQKDSWGGAPGYQLLFYSHVVLGFGMVLITLLYWRINLPSEDRVRWPHMVCEAFFACFILFLSAVTTGWIDPLIHGQLTVYIIGCFGVALFFHLRPTISFFMYLASYLIVIIGITRNQHNLIVLNGHYINSLMLIFVSWTLSLTLYKSRFQEFIQQNHLEQLVKERTAKLEEMNQLLTKAVWERGQIEEKVFRLASIVESSEDGIIGMTFEGTITDWNRGAECIYGYSEVEIIGESVKKLIPPDKQFEFNEVLLAISQGRPFSHYETTRIKKDGQIINVYMTISPIKDYSGKSIGVSTIVRDVTAQLKLEKEMVRMDQLNLVGEMAASIGHEVRNPMTTVKGFLQLLGENKNSAKFSEYIPLMISEIDRANTIITEFLSISRTKITEFARHNLNEIINNILPLVQADAIRDDKWVTIQLETIPDLILDENEIRQVILNLTRNGLEAMGKGGSLIIKTSMLAQEVILEVQDEGEGIKPEVMDKLGTPFFTTKDTGTGLGLAVCYGIAARHDAKISVQTSSRGTRILMKFKKSFDLA